MNMSILYILAVVAGSAMIGRGMEESMVSNPVAYWLLGGFTGMAVMSVIWICFKH